ncbi:MAG: type 1 glutamine amidotransferase [Acidobacteriaceae bacterium]
MRIHVLQHVEFEGPAAIENWARHSGHALTHSRVDKGDPLPELTALDLLVIMGGPMSVNDEHQHPWLKEEKAFVRSAIESRRAVLGVCLGAQMIASAMGARVYRGREKEIGWFPVRRVTASGAEALFPETFTPLHWHGETFDLPAGAVRLAETEAVPNQAFQLGSAIGLQFHLEATPESVQQMVDNAGHEIENGKSFQQTAQEILAQAPHASPSAHAILYRLLDHLTGSESHTAQRRSA